MPYLLSNQQCQSTEENFLKTDECQQQQQQPFYGPLPGTIRVCRYQKKHSPTHHPDHHPIFINFFHLPRSIASSLFLVDECQMEKITHWTSSVLDPLTSEARHATTLHQLSNNSTN